MPPSYTSENTGLGRRENKTEIVIKPLHFPFIKILEGPATTFAAVAFATFYNAKFSRESTYVASILLAPLFQVRPCDAMLKYIL